MSYPQGAPGGPGLPSAQQANAHFAAPTQQFAKVPESGVVGVSKLPTYLAAAVAALGLLVYLASFGPQFTAGREFFITPFRVDLTVVASVLAALVAAVGLLPRQTPRPALVGVLSLLSFLLVVSIVLTAPSAVTIGWGMYLVVAFTAIQMIVGLGALLLDAGIITAPAPRPRYEHPQYGPYPGAYYGQYPGQPPQGAPAHQQQRPGYPSQYGATGYPSAGPSTGGFPSGAPSGEAGPASESGPPTPPTGSPAYGQPKPGNTPAAEAPTQHQSASSSQSEQSSS